ncbi:STAS domain-containing protein [Nocardia sp. 348MFTsu5.1]|uniref:STAS domain-containing protein n=1 Tax=Nocardia sp. 348MFTsu5.1 TaxID=1172185 RepID=UPI0003788F5E|nr:STAS domain-containing protein [Nocardia sp. 348MFTsu5.1]
MQHPENSKFVDTSGTHAGSAAVSVVTSHHGELAILTVAGSLDVLTAPALSEAVGEALSKQPPGLIIDLTSADFLSSAGMTVLIAAQEAIAPSGWFGVVADGPSTARPMRLVGLDQAMTIYTTLEAAIDAMTDTPENRRNRIS